jgi:MYXO-CTERM domain-containing protein
MRTLWYGLITVTLLLLTPASAFAQDEDGGVPIDDGGVSDGGTSDIFPPVDRRPDTTTDRRPDGVTDTAIDRRPDGVTDTRPDATPDVRPETPVDRPAEAPADVPVSDRRDHGGDDVEEEGGLTPSEGGGGCSCRVAARGAGGALAGLTLLGLALALRRRRA